MHVCKYYLAVDEGRVEVVPDELGVGLIHSCVVPSQAGDQLRVGLCPLPDGL